MCQPLAVNLTWKMTPREHSAAARALSTLPDCPGSWHACAHTACADSRLTGLMHLAASRAPGCAAAFDGGGAAARPGYSRQTKLPQPAEPVCWLGDCQLKPCGRQLQRRGTWVGRALQLKAGGRQREAADGTSSVFSMSTTLIFHSDCIIAADWSSRYCAAASALPVTCRHTENLSLDT